VPSARNRSKKPDEQLELSALGIQICGERSAKEDGSCHCQNLIALGTTLIKRDYLRIWYTNTDSIFNKFTELETHLYLHDT